MISPEDFKKRTSLTFDERGFCIYFDGDLVHKDVETIARTKEYLNDLLYAKTGSLLSYVAISGSVTLS